ncbi:MAG: glycosyl transferase [Deltaproteobacteria bacterium RIFCSPLOWO2_12_FULL_60_19]|nr:MAG: glycosyl transferase [Deltaproteobacteria bacterium RIFCSPLOWO2_12_FULL_60_19]
MKLSVVVPVFNEAGTVEELLRRVRNGRFPKEIVVVDDGSTDGTREILSRLDAAARQATGSENSFQVIYQPYNRGKGAAVRTGLERVTGDVVIIQDADLEYDPEDYAKLLDPILTDKADVVYGTRFAGGGAHRVLFFWHSLGNRMLTLISNALTNLNLSDMEVGYKVFRSEVLKRIKLKSDRFGFEPEITMKVAKQGCRIYEVPISYHGRTYAEGKKITWRDGIAALYCLIRFRLSD